MNWRDCFVLLSAAAAWALYLGGLDEVPDWNGFGRGLVAGSTGALVVYAIARLIRRARAEPGPEREPTREAGRPRP